MQTFSIDGANGLTLDRITIDNSAGDTHSLGYNTDAFDTGDSIGVTISGANVKNNDDCFAINSGTVSNSSDPCQQYVTGHALGHNFHRLHMLKRTRSIHWLHRRPLRQHCFQRPHRIFDRHQLAKRHPRQDRLRRNWLYKWRHVREHQQIRHCNRAGLRERWPNRHADNQGPNHRPDRVQRGCVRPLERDGHLHLVQQRQLLQLDLDQCQCH